ncbi:MAG: P1 family peptidase [Chloroflexi bacterium]|nr:P1 family peptidase [Chloroflexota bacterium]
MSGNLTLTAVPGIKVGHATDPVGLTGCTVVLCDGPSGSGAVGGVDQRGGAPGTRETDLLRPLHLVQQVHAVVLAGGSAFGLAAADGVMRYLRERGVGYKSGPVRVPIVPAAILFDLAVGRSDVYPDAEMGYAACLAANDAAVAEGNVGAGTGCSAGKALGAGRATKTGLGSAAIDLGGGLVVAALIAVNPFGDVVDEASRIVAGTRRLRGAGFADTLVLLRTITGKLALRVAGATVIGVVATNARLDKEGANKVAQMAQDGVARAIRPAHTLFDGDTLFALATGKVRASVTLVGAYAAEVVAQAIGRAARSAVGAGGLPAGAELGASC